MPGINLSTVCEMKFIVICGNEDCATEFSADSENKNWVCPKCQRIIPNKQYPFLDVKFMDACARPENADWKSLYEDLLKRAQELINERDNEIEKLKQCPDCKDTMRLKLIQSLQPTNEIGGLRKDLIEISKPYKEKLIKLWEESVEKDASKSLAHKINGFEQLFELNQSC